MDTLARRTDERPSPFSSTATAARGTRAAEPPEAELLRLALNQVDYGLVVLDADSGMLQFANGPGHAALDDGPGGLHPRDSFPRQFGLRAETGRQRDVAYGKPSSVKHYSLHREPLPGPASRGTASQAGSGRSIPRGRGRGEASRRFYRARRS